MIREGHKDCLEWKFGKLVRDGGINREKEREKRRGGY